MSIKSSFADAAGGVAGSLVAMLAFYPIDVLKVNLQANQNNTKETNNDKVVKKKRDLQRIVYLLRSKYPSNVDFLKSLFKGLHFKLAHTTTSSFAYFFIYSWIQQKHKIYTLSSPRNKVGKYEPTTTTRLILSALAAICNTILTLPLDVLASRSQVACSAKLHENTKYTISPATQTSEEDPHGEEKKEKEIITCNSSSSIERMNNVWRNVNDIDSDGDYDTANEDANHNDEISDSGGESSTDEPLYHFDLKADGYDLSSNSIESINEKSGENDDIELGGKDTGYVRPLFRVDTLTQPFPKHLVYKLSTLNKTKKKDLYKLTELWRGIRPSLLLCSNPSIHFTVFDSIKDILLKYKSRRNNGISKGLSMGEVFIIGLLAKFSATIATYPLIRAKVMLMVTEKKNYSDGHQNDDTMLGILHSMFERGGVVELYKGCSLQLVHTILKSALLMMVRERITITTRRFIL